MPEPRYAGPQCFAPAKPGSISADPLLVHRNLQIEKSMLEEAQKYYDAGDLRWFFTKAHGEITRLINENLDVFQRPDALLQLNIHFAEEFVRALWGQPHEKWKAAFKRCQALEKASNDTAALVGEAEFCGAAMAHVHIHIDLSAAINEVGCIPPEDYGNMLVFVKRGSLAALVKLRGQAIGAAEAMMEALVAPMVRARGEGLAECRLREHLPCARSGPASLLQPAPLEAEWPRAAQRGRDLLAGRGGTKHIHCLRVATGADVVDAEAIGFEHCHLAREERQ